MYPHTTNACSPAHIDIFWSRPKEQSEANTPLANQD